MVTWVVYKNLTKQVMAKQQSPAAVPPRQPDGFTAVVIPDSEFGDVFADSSRVDEWNGVGKKVTTRPLTVAELNARALT